MKKMAVAIAAALITLSALAAQATTFTLQGVNYDYLGAKVDFNYTYDAAHNQGVVDLDIKNISTDNSRLTSFAFNIPANVTGLVSLTGPTGWTGKFNPDNIGTPQAFGKFDVAGLTGNNFNGGFPNYGIPVGQTYDFLFRFAGTNLNVLTDFSFLGLDSFVNPKTADVGTPFIARFQRVGADGGLSDEAIISDSGSTPAPVPEPGTMVLLNLGILGFCVYFKRRNFSAYFAS